MAPFTMKVSLPAPASVQVLTLEDTSTYAQLIEAISTLGAGSNIQVKVGISTPVFRIMCSILSMFTIAITIKLPSFFALHLSPF